MCEKVYTADFETHNSIIDIENKTTGVWLWDICDIVTLQHNNGNSIQTFFKYLEKISPCIIYFHNLAFDGAFIIDYFLRNNWIHSTEKHLNEHEFSTLITREKVFYNIKCCLTAKNKRKKHQIEFRDSMKKINASVDRIAKAYKLPILKGEISHTVHRETAHIATDDEIAYIKNDTEIIARVLKLQYDKGLTKLTTGADTLGLFKMDIGKYFKIMFPVLNLCEDEYIRKAYKGGVVQVNKKYQGLLLTAPTYVYDINSMYPAQMVNELMPFGKPYFFKGEYVPNKDLPLYIQRISIDLKVKDNFRPTILANNSRLFSSKYIEDTDNEMIELTLTNIDIELLKKHYDIYNIKYLDGYMFRGSDALFKNFILPLYEGKCNSTGAEKEHFKLLLNALYGKFATNPKHINKVPYLQDNIVKYTNTLPTFDNPVYTAVSAFITAYARRVLFNTIQCNIQNFVYCDTDSVHLTEHLKDCEIHDSKLGAWAFEKTFKMANYLGQKTYYGITTDDEKYIKISGCPDKVKKHIELDNFDIGKSYFGKPMKHTVHGGVILEENYFTIKPR